MLLSLQPVCRSFVAEFATIASGKEEVSAWDQEESGSTSRLQPLFSACSSSSPRALAPERLDQATQDRVEAQGEDRLGSLPLLAHFPHSPLVPEELFVMMQSTSLPPISCSCECEVAFFQDGIL